MKREITNFLINNPKIFGISLMVLSAIIFMLNYNDKRSFDEHNVASWKAYFGSWVLIILFFILGVTLILK